MNKAQYIALILLVIIYIFISACIAGYKLWAVWKWEKKIESMSEEAYINYKIMVDTGQEKIPMYFSPILLIFPIAGILVLLAWLVLGD